MASELPQAWEALRGDRDNLRYGSLEQFSIPKYRLAGRGFVLGLGRGYRIRSGLSKGREILAIGSDSSRRQRSESLLSPVPRPVLDLIRKHESVDDPIKRQSAYIPIRQDARCSKRRKLSHDHQHPFSIIDPPTHDDPDDSSTSDDEDAANTVDAYESFRQDKVQQHQRELLKRTAAESQDVEAWLSLIEHQEALVRSSDPESKPLSASQRRTLIELRLSIFEQALSKVTDLAGRQRLIQGFLREGSKIWDSMKQHAEWGRLLAGEAPFDLRVMHINFLMSDPSTFLYDNLLTTLNGYFRSYASEKPSAARDKKVVYLLLRITLFLQQAGYTERAVAIWQAVLELNFFGPRERDIEDLTASFEEFWDSEMPRLGEIGSAGWLSPATFASKDNIAVHTQSQTIRTNDHRPLRPGPAWAVVEGRAERTCPAKTPDYVDDPFSIVLFPDVKPYLFKTSSNASRDYLLGAFLCFSRLPLIHQVHEWVTDAFLLQPREGYPFSGVLDAISLFAPSDNPSAAFSSRESGFPYSFAANVVRQIALAQTGNTELAVYALALELASSPSHAKKFAKKLLKYDPENIRLYNTYALAESRLGNTVAAERVWTTTIEQYTAAENCGSDRLILFHAWIWETLFLGQGPKAVSLLALLAEERPKLSAIQHDAPSIESKQSLSRSEGHIRAQLSKAYSQNLWNELVICADLLAILEYHIHDRNLEAALAAYNHVLSMSGLSIIPTQPDSQPKEIAVELIHSHRAHLIWLHMRTPGLQFRPRSIITSLFSSNNLFPTNSFLRQLSHSTSHKHGSIDRLRELTVHNPSPTSTTAPATASPQLHPLALLQTITNELARPATLGGTPHAIRAAFQHAKSSSSAPLRHSPAVQLAHLHWEMGLLRALPADGSPPFPPQQGQARSGATERGGEKAKKQKQKASKEEKRARKQQRQRVVLAFREAVAACPWVKEIYLAFMDEALRGDGDGDGAAEEWREVYDSMLGRGLRVVVECA